MTFPGRRGVLLLLLLAIAIVLPPYFGTYYTRFATQIAIYGMAALSVDLLLGYTGLITFGQAALFGVGAYAAGMLTVYGVTNAFVAWPLAILVSMLFALAIGSLSLRTRGFQFIMVTLAFAQMVYYFAQSLRNWGGDDGFTVPQRNHLGFVSLADHATFYYVVLVLLVLVIFVANRIVGSQFGMVIRGIRDNERRVAAVGFPPYRYKLVIFVIAGGIAGLAGALMANHAKFVSPATLSWQLSGELLAMVILGSANSLIGPILGAAFFLAFRDVLSDFTEHWMLFFGPLLVARVLLVKDGIWGMLLRATGAGDAPTAPEVDCPRTGSAKRGYQTGIIAMSEFVLEIHHLRKAFGALIATDDVTLSIRKGETHALIGPNGAGKTTLVGQLTGELRPDAGRITFDGRGHHRPSYRSPRAARAGAVVPDHQHLRQFHRRGERRPGRSGDRAPQLSVLDACRADCAPAPACAQTARGCRPRWAGQSHRIQDVAWSASPARARHGARHPPRDAAARRTDGGTRHRGIARDVAAPREHQGSVHDPPDRARHGRRVCARRPHLGSGGRPHHSVRDRGRNSKPSRRARGLSRRRG
jgi:branched-chain amino acid transport system permease protein